MLETMGREEMFLRLATSPAGRKDGVALDGGSSLVPSFQTASGCCWGER